MKRIYWRPRVVSRTALILIALISLAGLLLVEHFPVTAERPYYQEKLAASQLAKKAMERIYKARLEVGPEIDLATDPAESGLIGLPMSPVTSVSGNLLSKQTSVNPNFAAVVVDLLRRTGVKEGDVVLVGCSGSFPALNICTYAAIETLKAKPVVISSVSASQWGANVPKLLWIDMERILYDSAILNTHSAAASTGGYEDQGVGLPEEGRRLVREAIRRNGLKTIEAQTFAEAVDARMALYRKEAGHAPIRAYVNIGGGAVSVGRIVGKRLFNPGLNLRAPKGLGRIDGVMPRLINQGVPVIHLIEIPTLADRYHLPLAPDKMPEVGKADVFMGSEYNDWLAATVLAVILASLYGFIRSDIGFRLLRAQSRRHDHGHPEPMV